MSINYSAKHIKVLEGLDHVRLNPNMYISTTENSSHLIEEALDNALDEAMAGYADIIAVIVDTKTGSCSILDNGRGIPIEDNTPIIISTQLFSGGKFSDRKSAYKYSAGLFGVGLVAVYALSDEYKIEIYREGYHAVYEKNGDVFDQTLLEKCGKKKPFSTKIEFKAGKKYFDSILPDINRIRGRMTTASVELPKVRFILRIDDNQEVIHYKLKEYFKNELMSDGSHSDLIDIVASANDEKLSMSFLYEFDSNISPKFASAVNVLPVKNGGTHIRFITESLTQYFVIKAKKTDYKFNPKDVLVGLRAYVSLSLKSPKLKGQSKESLENSKIQLQPLIDDFYKQLKSILDKNTKLTNELMEHFHSHRMKMDLKNIKVNNSSSKGRGLKKFTKLRDCQSRNGELFIVEGDSAAGGIIQARNPKDIAVLPLKGKIPSFTNKKNILENKEIGEMINAFGTGVEPHFDISKFRYNKIVCCCDADADGGHIATLLTMNLAMLTPELIKTGHYYIAYTPLYAINETKTFIPLWDQKQLNAAIQQKRKITRYKGLGELNISDLRTCLLTEKSRYLVQVQWSNKLKKLVSLMNNVEEKRKLLNGNFD